MTVIVIPARLESTRLPRKLLLRQTGQTLIEHTYQAASRSQRATSVIVAADHPAIVAEVERFGGKALLTNANHQSGTDRIAEVAQSLPDCNIIVNVQGDEPELRGETIDLAISLLEENPALQMATLATPVRDQAKLLDPNCVKVVVNGAGEAMYFSRSPIPQARTWHDELLTSEPPNFLQHIGLYAYRREFLLRIANLPRPPIEQLESLEQLRVLHAGVAIKVGIIDHAVAGIDTETDYQAFVDRFAGQ